MRGMFCWADLVSINNKEGNILFKDIWNTFLIMVI